jgi:hypothetical protein
MMAAQPKRTFMHRDRQTLLVAIDVDAAFGLVPALPAAGARIFARATLLVQGEQPIEG